MLNRIYSKKSIKIILCSIYGLIFTSFVGVFSLPDIFTKEESFSYTHRLVRDVDSSIFYQQYIPLEFKSSFPQDVNVPNWPSLDELRDKVSSFSNKETKTLLVLPYLVDSLNVPDDFGYSLHLVYPLAYLRSLPYQTRQQVLSELGKFNSDLSNFLRDNFRKSLEQQLTQIREYFGQTYSDETIHKDIIPYIKTRDGIVSGSRALRIGLEAIGGNQEVLDTIIENSNIAQVVFGLKKANIIEGSKIGDLDKLKKALWAYRQVEGPIINVVELSNGSFYIYNEYALRRKAVEGGRITDITKLENWTTKHLEEMIKNDMEKKSGIFYNLTQQKVEDSLISQFAPAIIKEEGNFTEFVDENGNRFYGAGNLASKVFELEKTEPDTVFIATMNRPEALKKQLEAELANYEIFNHWAPIVVIDDSWNGSETEDALSKNKQTIEELRKTYKAQIIHVAEGTNIGSPEKLVKRYAEDLAKKYNSGEIKMDEAVREILKQKGILRDGKVKSSKLREYLKENMFYHISGVRNHMFLLAKGDNVIMNFDDDAPPETFMASAKKRKELAKKRKELEANGEILIKDKQYFPLLKRLGIEKTHQRYEDLMDGLKGHSSLLRIADIYYTSERYKKEDGNFEIYPVNTFSQVSLLNKKVGESNLLVMSPKSTLRGTMGIPSSKIGKYKDWIIYYIAFPFIGDQDTNAISQLINYAYTGDKNPANIQHTNRSALLVEGLKGFVGEDFNIFNRALLLNLIPLPSLGVELRLEEPPYLLWVDAPVMGKVLTAYSKVAGAQEREIGERAYGIPDQDFTEVVGAFAKPFYEEAVEEFREAVKGTEAPLTFLKQGKLDKAKVKAMERLKGLGKKYLEMVSEIKEIISQLQTNQYSNISGLKEGLSEKFQEGIDELMQKRLNRAIVLSELGKKIAEMESQNKTGENYNNIIYNFVREAVNFGFYNGKKVEDKIQDYSPKDKKDNYFYKVEIENGEVKEITRVSPTGLTYDKRSENIGFKGWREEDVNPDFKIRNVEQLPEGKILEIELGKQEKVRIFVDSDSNTFTTYSAVIKEGKDFSVRYVIDAFRKAAKAMRTDGETMILWPDVVEVAKNWRDY